MSDDRWEFYFTRVDGELGSIFFNESLEHRAPVAGYQSAVYLRLFMRNPRPDGLSSQEEFDALSAIDEALGERLSSPLAIYAGRATYAGRRDFFFYAIDADKVEETVTRVLETFPDYEFEMGSRDDPDWQTYRGYLLPTERDRQRIENRKVCEALKEGGDPLTSEREIDHWAYFPTEESRAEFVKRATAVGFRIRNTSDTDGKPEFGVQIFRVDAVDWDAINGVTLELFELARELGGNYDGWESPIESESSSLH